MLAQVEPITGDPFGIGWIATFAYAILAIMALLPLIKKRKQGVQSFNKSVILWLLFSLFMTIDRFVEYILIMNFGLEQGSTKIGANLSTWYFVPFVSVMAEFLFILYILRKYKFYSIPFILIFFISLSLYQYADITAFAIIITISELVPVILYLWKGWKNKDGLIYSLGIFTAFDFFVPYAIHYSMIFGGNLAGTIIYYPLFFSALFAVAYLNLGTWGWLDRHVFYDKEREKQIKNAWIGRLIEIEKKKPEVKKNGGKSIVLECPVCHVQSKRVFAHEVVLQRAKNEKGIVKMLLNEDKQICEHPFVAYVDREFAIRGYEAIDMKV
nr:hypothetical protein [Candidatus Sigynarchaeota archaeon]